MKGESLEKDLQLVPLCGDGVTLGESEETGILFEGLEISISATVLQHDKH